MSRYRRIYNVTQDQLVLEKGKWCDSFLCRGKGLMFRLNLPEDEGLIFVHGRESKVESAITMLFCFFSIGVVWLDKNMRVVDAKLAKPWRLSYAPQSAAQYYIEANPHILERVSVGDTLAFELD